MDHGFVGFAVIDKSPGAKETTKRYYAVLGPF
jgi:hypothetical protein